MIYSVLAHTSLFYDGALLLAHLGHRFNVLTVPYIHHLCVFVGTPVCQADTGRERGTTENERVNTNHDTQSIVRAVTSRGITQG